MRLLRLSLCLALGACAPKQQAAVSPDARNGESAEPDPNIPEEHRPYAATIRDRAQKAAKDERVVGALEALWDRVFADPELSGAGERFLERVAADPTLAAAINDYMTAAATEGAFTEELTQWTEANEFETDEEFSQAWDAFVDERFDDARVDAALDASLDELLEGKAIAREMNEFESATAREGGLVAGLARLLAAELALRHEEAGSPGKSDEVSPWMQKELKRIVTVESLVGFHVGFYEIVARDERLAKSFVALTEDGAFTSSAAAELGAVIASPSFREASFKVFAAILAPAIDEGELERTIRAVVLSEELRGATRELLGQAMQHPRVRAGWVAALSAAVASPDFALVVADAFYPSRSQD